MTRTSPALSTGKSPVAFPKPHDYVVEAGSIIVDVEPCGPVVAGWRAA